MASLAYAHKQFPFAERVAVLHYPPIYAGGAAREMLDAMAQYGVKRCFYGHLHAAAIRRAVQGNVEGVEYRLISAGCAAISPLQNLNSVWKSLDLYGIIFICKFHLMEETK